MCSMWSLEIPTGTEYSSLVIGANNDHMTPLLKQLQYLPMRFGAQFQVLVLAFKSLYCFGPDYLKDFVIYIFPFYDKLKHNLVYT